MMTAAGTWTTHPTTQTLDTIDPERLVIARLTEALAPAVIGVRRQDADQIELSVSRDGWRLSTIVLAREAAGRLWFDRLREIKLDYLVRDIERVASRRARWTYPRLFM